MREDDQKPDLRILHVSDLHFGPPYLNEVGEEALRSAHQLNPDVVVVSGDLTQRQEGTVRRSETVPGTIAASPHNGDSRQP